MRILRKVGLGFALVILVNSCVAADLAILRNGFSIRHERREVVGQVTRLYLSSTDPNGYVDVPTSEIERFDRDLTVGLSPGNASSQNLPDVIADASGRYHLDPDLVNSVIHAESGFNVRAVSRTGARGLMQLMPQTASELGVSDEFDARANVDGGTRYLRELLERYNFDLIKALAAYNAGPRRVEQYRGVPPYYETQAYVAKVVTDFNRKKLVEQKAAKKKASGREAPARREAALKPSAPSTQSQQVAQ